MKEDKVIYIGSTKSLKSRLRKHKLLRDFNTCIVLKEFKTRSEMLKAETTVIKFASLFGNYPMLENLADSFPPFENSKFITDETPIYKRKEIVIITV